MTVTGTDLPLSNIEDVVEESEEDGEMMEEMYTPESYGPSKAKDERRPSVSGSTGEDTRSNSFVSRVQERFHPVRIHL